MLRHSLLSELRLLSIGLAVLPCVELARLGDSGVRMATVYNYSLCVCVAVYVGVIMLICTMSLVLNIVVLNLYHRSPQTHNMPNWVRVVSIALNTFLRIKLNVTL